MLLIAQQKRLSRWPALAVDLAHQFNNHVGKGETPPIGHQHPNLHQSSPHHAIDTTSLSSRFSLIYLYLIIYRHLASPARVT